MCINGHSAAIKQRSTTQHSPAPWKTQGHPSVFLTQSTHGRYSYPHHEAKAERDRKLCTVLVIEHQNGREIQVLPS